MNKIQIYCFFGIFTLLGLTPISAQNRTNMSADVKNLIAKKISFNKEVGFGYRVQIFYGEETNAKKISSDFSSIYPDVSSKLVYNPPYWKVQVGFYRTKLEADRSRLIFSEKFSGLIVVSAGR